ncbi:hypothetical protein CEXT_473571 [Caerostris extrusa]|uniref:Uncharacterized protein n=1 Tax=Caerostris extrusa TaxID=172846 RepID=A0AAV4TQX4_CAEEX|nr:hypothetical protein CEXT_473571 [Caerostris extrusa]
MVDLKFKSFSQTIMYLKTKNITQFRETDPIIPNSSKHFKRFILKFPFPQKRLPPGSRDDFQPVGCSRNNRLPGEGGRGRESKTKRCVKIPVLVLLFRRGHVTPEFRTPRDSSQGDIDEQTTAQGAFLTVAVNFAIFTSLRAVCRACLQRNLVLYVFRLPLRAKRFS